jgi:hypothetical protein
MLRRITNRLLRPFARKWVTDYGAKQIGTGRLLAFGKRYNSWCYREEKERHDRAFREERDALLRENGGDPAKLPSIPFQDGWALDTSRSLPFLDDLLREAGEIARERGGKMHSAIQQPFLRNFIFPGDLEKYPSFLNFITSSPVLALAMDYLKTVPVLSRTRPPGVRFMESNAKLDPHDSGPYRESQLYHLDLHDTPLIYVLVAIEDIQPSSGPWTFLPASASDRAARAINYRASGVNYRMPDEMIYGAVDRNEAIEFSGPKGSVLFIDSSRCFHYGSRHACPPRFQVMYALTSVCRTDLSQTFMGAERYPVGAGDSRLRRMVCSAPDIH